MFTDYKKPSGIKRTSVTQLNKYTLIFRRLYTDSNELVCHHIQNDETEELEASFSDLKKAVKCYEEEYMDFVILTQEDRDAIDMVDWVDTASKQEMLSHLALKSEEELRKLLQD